MFGWGGRIRTYGCGNQNPVPYRLATPQYKQKYGAGDKFRTCYLQSHNLALYRLSYARHILVRPERLEPPTHGLEGRCSILLSYGRISIICAL